MRIALGVMIVMFVATMGAGLGGCKSDAQRQLEANQVILAPPMEHDPTQRIDLAQWWSNGTHLLRLDDNAAYALFEGVNRYSRPIEYGRWAQQSYALLWLEPYTTLKMDPRRVSIAKVDGELALLIPKLNPMFALPLPPTVLEDRMIGQWSGPLGSLQLGGDMRFSLTPTSSETVKNQTTHMFAIRKGTWRVVENQLVLQPDVAGVEPMRLPLAVTDDEVVIAVPGGGMARDA